MHTSYTFTHFDSYSRFYLVLQSLWICRNCKLSAGKMEHFPYSPFTYVTDFNIVMTHRYSGVPVQLPSLDSSWKDQTSSLDGIKLCFNLLTEELWPQCWA